MYTSVEELRSPSLVVRLLCVAALGHLTDVRSKSFSRSVDYNVGLWYYAAIATTIYNINAKS